MMSFSDSPERQTELFAASVAEFRTRWEDRIRNPAPLANAREREAHEFERELMHLLFSAARPARAPLEAHMAKLMEALVIAQPFRTFTDPHSTYPDRHSGATGLVTSTTPHFTTDGVHVLTRMVMNYMPPIPYTTRFAGYMGYSAGFAVGSSYEKQRRMGAFIHDVIHLVDNPNQIKPVEPGQ